ncbi:hypothetical protein I317_00138 [Kwoniella heveanensis CBS 569]|nr:hypothetical protein I317_00138 [Kwoniella heveanensis CBS 569]
MPPPTNTANGTSEQQTQQRSKQRGSYAAPSKPYALPFGTYRPGPPSISSTISSTATSYAESIASDVTIVASRSYKSNDRQSWESPLKIKVDTNVAPSSHIWDEFYAASGGTPSSQPSTQKGSQPDVEPEATEGNEDTADAVQMMEFGARNDTDVGSTRQREENDIASSDALSELLSMFDLPQFPTQEPSTINQHLINSKSNSQSYQIQQDTSDPNARAQAQFQNDQYPGAEFLNLPDTASTTDNSQYPALFDDFDFSHFTFPINSRCGDVSSDPSIATASLDGVQEMESASNLGSSPLDTVSWKQSLERPSHAEGT